MSVPMVETYRAGPPRTNNVQQPQQQQPLPPQSRNTLKPYANSNIPRSRSSAAPIPLSPQSSTFPRRSPVPPPATHGPGPTSPRYPPPNTDFARQPIVPHGHTPSPPPPYMASPPPGYGGAPPYPPYMQHPPPATQIRRNSSNATSTSSNSGGAVRRSSSNRASSSASHNFSYVMRLRAKVAVSWCDRGQAEDPRIMAEARRAKERAEREVALPPAGTAYHHHAGSRGTPAGPGVGAAATTQLQHQPDGGSSSFTSGVARKIRHHGGAPKASKYGGGNLVGAGVPMRLSANEVDDDDEVPPTEDTPDDEWGVDASFYGAAAAPPMTLQLHRYEEPQKVLQIHQHRRSVSGGPRLGLVVPPDEADEGEATSPEATPLASTFAQRDYVYQQQQQAAARRTGGGEVEEERRREEELKRRGSVDDRAMTMSGVRLYVANPDVDD
jgi:hypothetical protein